MQVQEVINNKTEMLISMKMPTLLVAVVVEGEDILEEDTVEAVEAVVAEVEVELEHIRVTTSLTLIIVQQIINHLDLEVLFEVAIEVVACLKLRKTVGDVEK
jgi:hypothetical protein